MDRLISEKALLDKIDEWKGFDTVTIRLSTLRNIVKAIPSAEPKTGHWILQPSNKEQGERDFIWWRCSECGQVIYSETEKDKKEFHAFCGRCGAKMIES